MVSFSIVGQIFCTLLLVTYKKQRILCLFNLWLCRPGRNDYVSLACAVCQGLVTVPCKSYCYINAPPTYCINQMTCTLPTYKKGPLISTESSVCLIRESVLLAVTCTDDMNKPSNTCEHALQWKSAAGYFTAVLILIRLHILPYKAEGILKQHSALLCSHKASQQNITSMREHLVSMQITRLHHGLIRIKCCGFYLTDSCTGNLAFFQILWLQSKIPDRSNNPNWVSNTHLRGGFLFGSVQFPHSKSACRLKVAHLALAVKWLQISGLSANDKTVTGLEPWLNTSLQAGRINC